MLYKVKQETNVKYLSPCQDLAMYH